MFFGKEFANKATNIVGVKRLLRKYHIKSQVKSILGRF